MNEASLSPGGWLERLCRPAFGTVAPRLRLSSLLLALVLVLAFFLYSALGFYRPAGWLGKLALFGAPMLFLAPWAGLAIAGSADYRRAVAWLTLLASMSGAISLAAAADSNAVTPLPLVNILILALVSMIFRRTTVLAMGLFAAAGTVAAEGLADGAGAEPEYFLSLCGAAVILASAVFLGTRSESEEALRKSLMEALARERLQGAATLEALAAARRNAGRLEALSEHSPAVLALFEAGGRPTYLSRVARQLAGRLDMVELESADLTVHANPDQVPALLEAFAGAVAGVVGRLEFEVREPSGAVRTLEGVFFPAEEGAGLIAVDVTEARHLAAHMARAQRMETIGTLAGGIAHDFNNLLAVVLGNLQMLRLMWELDTEAQAVIDDAGLACERGAELVRRLLDFSRPRLGELKPVSAAELVAETVALARASLPRTLALEVDAAADGGVAPLGDYGSLQQVLLNLIMNARDALPQGGTISIDARRVEVPGGGRLASLGLRPGPHQVIRVRDDGTGIEPEVLARVFDPFFTTKGPGKGTGLGLAMSQTIVGGHGGIIDVESSPGSGSTFSVYLPLQPRWTTQEGLAA